MLFKFILQKSVGTKRSFFKNDASIAFMKYKISVFISSAWQDQDVVPLLHISGVLDLKEKKNAQGF